MKFSKMYRPIISGILCTALLSGFTGKEQFVELESATNGRTSTAFRGDNNILGTLPQGTQGQILDSVQLPSGNYGLQIKVLNGEQQGKIMWVYHKKRGDSSLALYESIPRSWDKAPKTENTDKARAALTLKEVDTYTDPDGEILNDDSSETDPSTDSNASSTVAAIDEMNSRINRNTQPKDDDSLCLNCTVSMSGTRNLLRPAKNSLNSECSQFMSSSGQIGPAGKIVLKTMSSPSNIEAFTQDGALGKFCPQFNSLSQSDRLVAWTWFWTALAKEESGCDYQAIHHTKRNGKVINPRLGYGLWALEKSAKTREWRGPECDDISDIQGQAACAIEIMKDTQLNAGRSANSRASYWGPVRRSVTQIIPHMQRLSLCF